MTQRKLRVSGYNDYIAVDLVNEQGKIESTPFYFQKNKPSFHYMFDQEEGKWFRVKFLFDGTIVTWTDIDHNSDFKGMSDKLNLDELLDPTCIKP